MFNIVLCFLIGENKEINTNYLLIGNSLISILYTTI